MVEQGSKRLITLTGDGMIARRDENEAIDRERMRLQISELHDIGNDADLNVTARYGSDDLMARVFLEVDIDPGVIGEECRKSLGEKFAQCGCICLHPDTPLDSARIFGQFALLALGSGEGRPRTFQIVSEERSDQAA